MSFRGWVNSVVCRQNPKPELLTFHIDASATNNSVTSTDGMLEGSQYATILRTNTGQYTLTLNDTARKIVNCVGGAGYGNSAGIVVCMGAVPTANAVTLRVQQATDGAFVANDFMVTLLAFYSDR